MMDNIESSTSSHHWYAIWCRSRHEKSAAARLEALQIPHYLPLIEERHQWTDRIQIVHVPLLAGYLFVQIDPHSHGSQLLKVPGIVRILGNEQGPLPIPDEQIHQIQLILSHDIPCKSFPYIAEGDPVRVIRGVLKGIEAKFVRVSSKSSLIISIETIGQSIAVNIAAEDVEPVQPSSEGLPRGSRHPMQWPLHTHDLSADSVLKV